MCLELRTDKVIPEASVLHDNERIAVLCTDALIAMEAVYQKTCYRDFTRTVTRCKSHENEDFIDNSSDIVQDYIIDLTEIQISFNFQW